MVGTVPQMGRPKKAMKTRTVRLDDELVWKIGIIAAAHDQQVPDWLSDAIRSLIDREYEKAQKIIEAKKARRAQ